LNQKPSLTVFLPPPIPSLFPNWVT
jgi:hypothetical protein